MSWINNEFRKNLRFRHQTEPFHLTEREKQLYVELHNKYRRSLSLSAADMQYMEWDDNLARIAQKWADRCIWEHGYTTDPSFEDPMGQNLYNGYNRDPHNAMKLWFNEYVDYDFHSNTCQPNQQCGHYTQIIWANSRLVGCALKIDCNGLYKYYIVCNYYPAGNFVGQQPYKVGQPCTKCFKSDGALCSDKLCVTNTQCKRNNLKCDCNLNCQNCGELNREKCQCQCRDGWDGFDCSVPCLDGNSECNKYTCSFYEKRPNWINPCRKTCNYCNVVNKSNLQNTCCDGDVCPNGYVLNIYRPCSCDILCPGTMCSAATSSRLISAVTILVVTFLKFASTVK